MTRGRRALPGYRRGYRGWMPEALSGVDTGGVGYWSDAGGVVTRFLLALLRLAYLDANHATIYYTH